MAIVLGLLWVDVYLQMWRPWSGWGGGVLVSAATRLLL